MPSKNTNISIFILNDKTAKKLYSFDIRYMEKHLYILFLIKRAISSYPKVYFLVVSINLFVSDLSLTVYWR